MSAKAGSSVEAKRVNEMTEQTSQISNLPTYHCRLYLCHPVLCNVRDIIFQRYDSCEQELAL